MQATSGAGTLKNFTVYFISLLKLKLLYDSLRKMNSY